MTWQVPSSIVANIPTQWHFANQENFHLPANNLQVPTKTPTLMPSPTTSGYGRIPKIPPTMPPPSPPTPEAPRTPVTPMTPKKHEMPTTPTPISNHKCANVASCHTANSYDDEIDTKAYGAMDSHINTIREAAQKMFKLKTHFLKTLLAADLQTDSSGFVSNTTEKIGDLFFLHFVFDHIFQDWCIFWPLILFGFTCIINYRIGGLG